MTKIAIVGNIASGKSCVEKILMDKGFTVYDTDKIAHEILEKSDEAKKIFPQAVINRKFDRKILASIVFNDIEKKKILENIIHPEVINFIKQLTATTVFVSVPLLFEANMETLFDKIIFISAPKEIRLERLMKRNNLSEEEAKLRINAQLDEDEKIKKSDFVIFNNSTTDKLKDDVEKILASIC